MKSAVGLLVLLFVGIRADKGFGEGEQKWNYAEVRDGAYIFWWLYYTTATENYTERPLVIWLQGGPGSSSTGYGNFAEIGPLDVDLNIRPDSWTKDVNLLFIDNPVGTGFSYVEDTKLLARNNSQIAIDLVEALRQIYQELPEFEPIPLYIMTESYGGKMGIELSLRLHEAISAGTIKSNFKGIGLGDPLINPIDAVEAWAPYMYTLGLVDDEGREQIEAQAARVRQAVEIGVYNLALTERSRTISLLEQLSGRVNMYNVLTPIRPAGGGVSDDEKIAAIMTTVKTTLGLVSNYQEQSRLVSNALGDDIMIPVTDLVETVLNTTDIKVSVFSGQLDLRISTRASLKWIHNANFKGKEEWIQAERTFINVDGVIEGYSKKAGHFYFYWADRAGHMVAADNKAAMGAILSDFTDNYQV